jgi:parallel beta-helix repeat protein
MKKILTMTIVLLLFLTTLSATRPQTKAEDSKSADYSDVGPEYAQNYSKTYYPQVEYDNVQSCFLTPGGGVWEGETLHTLGMYWSVPDGGEFGVVQIAEPFPVYRVEVSGSGCMSPANLTCNGITKVPNYYHDSGPLGIETIAFDIVPSKTVIIYTGLHHGGLEYDHGFGAKWVRAYLQRYGTIYIRSDGSVDPTEAPVSRDGDMYTLTANISSIADGIVIERNNMTLDGAGYTIRGNGLGNGIYVSGRSNVTIRNTVIGNFTQSSPMKSGILLYSSTSCRIYNNTLSGNYGGIWLVSSSNYNNISQNSAIANQDDGILMNSCNWNRVFNNTVIGNSGTGHGIQFAGGSCHNTVSRNTVANNLGGIYLTNGDNHNVILENDIKQNGADGGIYAMSTTDNSFLENRISNSSKYEIWLRYSTYCRIEGNNMTTSIGTVLHDGIYLDDSDYNNISDNNIVHRPKATDFCGISLGVSSVGNRFSGNYIANTTVAIGMGKSSNNTFARNSIIDNAKAIEVDDTSVNNSLYHNSFINNDINLRVLLGTPVETWDDGYPSGGNYWSDYSGSDLFWGPYQNLTGSDGIGDINYTLDPRNVDRYPLTRPWAAPDVAVSHLSTSKDDCVPMPTVGKNCTVSINVTVSNEGHTLQIFNLTVSANLSQIYARQTTLSNGSSTSFVVVWNTTESAYGDYNITVKIGPLPDEEDLGDNIKATSKLIRVTIPGDVDGDFYVFIFDVVKITGCYGKKRGDALYNPNADIDDNGVINIFDVVLCTSNYGKKLP